MFSYFRQPKETIKQKTLQQLKALDVYQEHTYEGETAQAIERFQTTLQATIETVIQLPIDEKKEVFATHLATCEAQATALQLRFSQAKHQWEEEKKAIRAFVEKGVTFVQTTNFYPPEYVFHLNKIEGFLIEIDELQTTNPFASPLSFRTFCTQVEQDIAAFSALREETIRLVTKIEQKCTTKEKTEPQAILECKESLFRALQMGNLVQAHRELKQLKKEYKRL